MSVNITLPDSVKDPFVRKAYGYLRESMDHPDRQEWIKRRDEGWRFFEGKQWTDEELDLLREVGMPDYIVNKLTGHVRTKATLITDNKPRIDFAPVGGGDDGVAQVLKRGVDNIWDALDCNDKLFDLAIEHGCGGMGYLVACWDKDAGIFGHPKVREQDPKTVHIDPLVKKSNLYDGRFILVADRITRSEAMTRFGVQENELLEVTSFSDDEEDRKVQKDNPNDDYGENQDKSRQGLEPGKPAKTVWYIEAWQFEYDEMRLLINRETMQVRRLQDGEITDAKKFNAKAEALGDGSRVEERRRRVVKYGVIVGSKLLEPVRTNPYGEDSSFAPVVGVIPMLGTRQRGAYANGDAWFMAGVQREMNKRRGQIIHTTSTQSSANLFVPEGSMTPENEAKSKKLNQVVHFKAVNGLIPQRMSPGSVAINDAFLLVQLSDRDMQDIAGLPEAIQGRSDAKSSGKKVMALQEAAMLQAKPTIKSMESVIVHLGRVLGHLLISYAPQAFWMRLFDPQKEPWLVPYVQQIMSGDVSILNYDIRVATGSSLPTMRMAKVQAMAELQPIFGPNHSDIFAEHIARYLDEPGLADQIMARNAQIKQAAAMQQLQTATAGLAQAGMGGLPPGAAAGGPQPPPGMAPQ